MINIVELREKEAYNGFVVLSILNGCMVIIL